MTYTLRPTYPETENDYVFKYNGVDVGRCYLRKLSDKKDWWGWTIYTGVNIKKMPEGVPSSGMAETLETAQGQFKAAFDKVVAAGAFS